MVEQPHSRSWFLAWLGFVIAVLVGMCAAAFGH